VGDEGRTSTSEVEMEVVAGEVAIKVSESNKNGGVKFEKKAKKVDSDDESEDDTSRKPTKKAESSGGGMVCVCASARACWELVHDDTDGWCVCARVRACVLELFFLLEHSRARGSFSRQKIKSAWLTFFCLADDPRVREFSSTGWHGYVQSRPQLWLFFAGRPGML
jgi:hypothetical protein